MEESVSMILFEQLVNSSPDGIFAFDREGRCIAWNPAIARLFDLPAEQMLGQRVFEAVPAFKENGEGQWMDRVLSGQEVVSRERSFFDPHTGQPRYYTARYAPLRRPDGEASGGMATVREVTDQKRLVDELAVLSAVSQLVSSTLEFDAILHLIIEHTAQYLNAEAISVALLDDEGDELVFATAYGQQADFVVGKRIRVGQGIAGWVAQYGEPLLVPNVRKDPRFFDQFDRQTGFLTRSILCVPMQIKGRVIGVIEALNKSVGNFNHDDLRLLLMLATPAAQAIENSRLYAQAQREIAARKQAEEALQAYRQQLEQLVRERTADLERAVTEANAARERINTILRSIADSLIVTDLDRRVILANPAAEARLGVSLAQMVGQKIDDVITDVRLREVVNRTLSPQSAVKEATVEIETEPGGRPRYFRVRSAAVGNRNETIGTVTLIQDVTRLHEINRLKTELINTVAHELRTPLTSILGFSEILTTRALDATRQERYLLMIHEQAAALSRIVEDLLDIARLESGRPLDLSRQPVNLARLIQEVLEPFRETAPDYHFDLEGLDDLPPVEGDPFRLAQVCRNLLSNAVKFSPPGSTIRLAGRQVDEAVEISIQDRGIGMTEEQQKFLFEPFYRADTSNTARPGVGLGLAISRMIIEQHGGHIWLESRWQEGTTVYFTLPLLNGDVPSRQETDTLPRQKEEQAL